MALPPRRPFMPIPRRLSTACTPVGEDDVGVHRRDVQVIYERLLLPSRRVAQRRQCVADLRLDLDGAVSPLGYTGHVQLGAWQL